MLERQNYLPGLVLRKSAMKNDSEKRKALIIGLDGVPYSLLNAYLEQGVMPRLRKILDQGLGLHPMNASIPDVSSVSWTSFATGVNPGEHGIYGFVDLNPRDYSLYFPNSRDIHAPPFWEILGKTDQRTSTLGDAYRKKVQAPCRSIIFNLPHTYPAVPIHGILVSGFVAIDLKKAVFPDSAYSYLKSFNYQIDVEAETIRKDKKQFLNELFECFEMRKKAIDHFFLHEPWDLFLACITETDRLHHFFFDAAMDRAHPFHEEFIEFYGALDDWLNMMFEEFMKMSRGKGLFMVLSDHGFAPIKKEVYINPFLRKAGFLELNSEGQFFQKLGRGTRAFNLDPCRIYVNYEEVYGRGTVRKEEGPALLKEIREALNTLRGEGNEEVIDSIYLREEIYRGPRMDQAPDMVCLPKPGYDLKGGIDRKEIFGQNIFTGMHTRHDAFCILPGDYGWTEKPSIDQLASPVLQYFTR
jgi:predicted AlkP superfamily phosphohydrolase/phosphomutase